MVDFANDIYMALHKKQENFPGFTERRNEVLARLEKLQDQSSDIMNLIQDPNVIQQLKQDKLANITFLTENYNVREKKENPSF